MCLQVLLIKEHTYLHKFSRLLELKSGIYIAPLHWNWSEALHQGVTHHHKISYSFHVKSITYKSRTGWPCTKWTKYMEIVKRGCNFDLVSPDGRWWSLIDVPGLRVAAALPRWPRHALVVLVLPGQRPRPRRSIRARCGDRGGPGPQVNAATTHSARQVAGCHSGCS